MKTLRRITAFVLASVVGVSFASCGKSESYFEDVIASDYVTLGQYTNIEISREELDEHWKTVVESVRSANSEAVEVTDRTSAVGDTVTYTLTAVSCKDATIDLTKLSVTKETKLKLEKEPGEDDDALEENHLVGLNAALLGRTVSKTPASVSLTTADDYSTDDETLNGVTFTADIVISSVTEDVLPDEVTVDMLNDYYLLSYYYGLRSDYTTVDECKEDFVNNMLASEVFEKIQEGSTINGRPEEDTKSLYHMLLNSYNDYAAENGTDFETYLASKFGSLDAGLQQLMSSAENQADQFLIYLAIYQAENLDSSEEYKAIKDDEDYKSYDKDYLKLLAKVRAASNFLSSEKANNKAVEGLAKEETEKEDDSDAGVSADDK